MNKSTVSIVIPVYNQLKMTIACLNDLLKTPIPTETIVIDDGSKREPISKALPKLFPQVKLLTNDTNLGFAKTVNKGIKASTGTHILLLNNDIRLHNPNFLQIMLDNMKKRNLDLTAPKGGRMCEKTWEYQPGEATKTTDSFTFLPFWCCLIKREVFDRIGFIDESYGKGFWEDVTFCLTAKKAGFKMGITEGTGVEHLYHRTFRAEGYDLAKEYEEKRKIFLKLVKKI